MTLYDFRQFMLTVYKGAIKMYKKLFKKSHVTIVAVKYATLGDANHYGVKIPVRIMKGKQIKEIVNL